LLFVGHLLGRRWPGVRRQNEIRVLTGLPRGLCHRLHAAVSDETLAHHEPAALVAEAIKKISPDAI
jgi:hypothetical protein